MKNLPLEGIKVVELTTYAAAPMAGMCLADWGADVIKVESLSGDAMRNFGKFMSCIVQDDDNIQFELGNRNKRGISIDLKTPLGMEILQKMLSSADVLVTNMRTNALEKLKLDYKSLSSKYVKLIFAQINGYGDFGPEKDKPGFDVAAYFARSGILVEFVDKGSDPLTAVAGFGDHTTGTFLAGGICAALYGRERTGRGCKLQTSLYNAALWNLSLDIAAASQNGHFPLQGSRSKPRSAVVNTYKTKDEHWITVIILEYDRFIKPFFETVLKKPELINDERFNNQANSFQHSAEFTSIIDEVFNGLTLAECVDRLKKVDIVHEVNQRWHEIKNDPQALENGYIMEIKMPSGRTDWIVGNPAKFDDEMTTIRRQAPLLGEHNLEVLAELGYSGSDIANFKKDKIIK
jgi:crotonobetainyl-CoA:carnitine CoA-transferase CaiB-like acyl-CoA transferase